MSSLARAGHREYCVMGLHSIALCCNLLLHTAVFHFTRAFELHTTVLLTTGFYTYTSVVQCGGNTSWTVYPATSGKRESEKQVKSRE